MRNPWNVLNPVHFENYKSCLTSNSLAFVCLFVLLCHLPFATVAEAQRKYVFCTTVSEGSI